ncbi:hypothetical protein FB567DRAFT_528499 [Paraphoma chrysanthemicola]|uniref:Uncharacterized protein n=1 Tax=Paraphoma chrysanthemicola TaxID=798071 RepID=A0A8K0R578_9PLEO|nr:hypothetical protein FB567DRAFT_528499 [Paraphoma chrysanthemicola]
MRRAVRPSATLENGSEVDQLLPNHSSITSGTSHHTPPSSPSDVDHNRDDVDPDVPLPSVESYTAESRSTTTTVSYTPSLSPDSRMVAHGSDHDSVLHEIGNLRELRIHSPEMGIVMQGASLTPSVHVTPSIPLQNSSHSRSNRDDSIVGDFAALEIQSPQADSLSANGPREGSSPPSLSRHRSPSMREECPIPIHEVEAEDPPSAFGDLAGVQKAFDDARTLTQRIVTVLSSSDLHHENGSSIQNLHQQATTLAAFKPLSSRIVGLVGDSGVGKSSLINSLLDKRDFARASANSAACTCVVTEYHYHDRDDLIVNIDYFPDQEVEKQLGYLLKAYRDSQSLAKDRSDGGEDKMTDSEKVRLEATSHLAMDIFQMSFRERLRENPEILLSMPFDHAVATMVGWVLQLRSQQADRNVFTTTEECQSWLDILSSETNSSSPLGDVRKSWPFMQKVRVYLKAYILSKGLIIADLPGRRDLNSIRQAITERYMRECHQIFVVAKIDRAITDESIKQVLDLARHAKMSKVDIVCTFSEGVKTGNEAIKDWESERATIKNMQDSLSAVEDYIQYCKAEIKYYRQIKKKTPEEQDKLSELQTDKDTAEEARHTHEWNLKRFLVELRNAKVSNGLQKEYRDHPIAASLGIYCIDNELYREHRNKPVDDALPYLISSGILDLRRYCIGLVAQSRRQEMKTFIKDKIPALIGSVELWIDNGSGDASAESRKRVLDAVSAIQSEFDKLKSPDSMLEHISRTLETDFAARIYPYMRQNGPKWSAKARQASLSWSGWNASSYKAFCSNYGDHWTEAKGYRCWNEEATHDMAIDLTTVWDSFSVELATKIESFNDTTMQIYEKVLEGLSSPAANGSRALQDCGSSIRTLASNLMHREHLTHRGIEEVTEAFDSKLSSLRADTLSSVRTAFIGKHMESTYHAANMEYGSNSHRRRANLITGRFGSAALFHAHRGECSDNFAKLAQELQENLIEAVRWQVKLVEADLELIRDSNAISESERDIEFNRRVNEEMRSVKEEITRLGNLVREA